jgi:hypothetical protein
VKLAVAPCTAIADADAVFRQWLGPSYDLEALHVVLATAAVERLAGDPAWLLLVSGAGFTKTETVSALEGAGAILTSTIASEAALLSGTSKKDVSRDATGGLLRRLGARGVLVIKDVTSVLSMNRDTRSGVLAALREIYDGRWERNVGTNGGRSLNWTGRLVVIGATTTVWDRAHEVVSAMGDRFVLCRMDSTQGRLEAGRQAIQNTGAEVTMRRELSEAVADVMDGVATDAHVTLTEDEQSRILEAANVVTLARTAVDYDYRGDVVDSHSPEAPTRFAKQLSQVFRGAVAIGLRRADAIRLAIRCARESMPPLRLAILQDVAIFPGTTTRDVRKRLQKPRNTVDRQLQALHILGLVVCEEEETADVGGRPASVWRYRLADGIDLDALIVPDLSPHILENSERESA